MNIITDNSSRVLCSIY